MKNIVFIGFMGTGKTVTAKALAKRLRMHYISIDDLIAAKIFMKRPHDIATVKQLEWIKKELALKKK